MSSVIIGILVFLVVFSGAIIGMLLNRLLPEDHLAKETQDVIRLSTGMLSVLASLLLGLLIASAKTSFDHIDSDVRQFSGIIIQLGDTLRGIGPEAEGALGLLRNYTLRNVNDHKGGIEEPTALEDIVAGNILLQLRDEIIALPDIMPKISMLHTQAWVLFQDLQQRRWKIIQESPSTFPPALLIILVAWIALIFLTFGFNAPHNATVFVSLLVCSAAIGCAIFLVHEMDEPFDGFIQISREPMETALAHLAQ